MMYNIIFILVYTQILSMHMHIYFENCYEVIIDAPSFIATNNNITNTLLLLLSAMLINDVDSLRWYAILISLQHS